MNLPKYTNKSHSILCQARQQNQCLMLLSKEKHDIDIIIPPTDTFFLIYISKHPFHLRAYFCSIF